MFGFVLIFNHGKAAQDQKRRPPPSLVEVPPQLKLKAVGPTLVFLFFFLLPMTVTVQVFFFLLFISLSFCCSHPWLLRSFGFVLIFKQGQWRLRG